MKILIKEKDIPLLKTIPIQTETTFVPVAAIGSIYGRNQYVMGVYKKFSTAFKHLKKELDKENSEASKNKNELLCGRIEQYPYNELPYYGYGSQAEAKRKPILVCTINSEGNIDIKTKSFRKQVSHML